MDNEVKISAPKSVVETAVSLICKENKHLYAVGSRASVLIKKAMTEEKAPSNLKDATGSVTRPFNFNAVKSFFLSNSHHAACVSAKTNASVGLGFDLPENQDGLTKTEEILNPLCNRSFMEVLNDVSQDYEQTANAYIEIKRSGKEIVGIYHIQSEAVFFYVETNGKYHFVVTDDTGERHFPVFGDKESYIERNSPGTEEDEISEVIHFAQSSSISKWYGYPNWIAATAAIELLQCLKQYKYDFFNNRGVPEFLLIIAGVQLGKDQWELVENSLKSQVGLGNSHKSIALNLPDAQKEQMEVILHKLAMEKSGEQDFAKFAENQALEIVSAHGVPPMLAGIAIPGRLGGSSEWEQALKIFQALKIGPTQKYLMNTLGATLGNQLYNGSLSLTTKDFKLKTILQELGIDEKEEPEKEEGNVVDIPDPSIRDDV